MASMVGFDDVLVNPDDADDANSVNILANPVSILANPVNILVNSVDILVSPDDAERSKCNN